MAQHKLVPVASSELTGISLPGGSRRDNRGLSSMSAKMLLEIESKARNCAIGKTEVLQLPSEKQSGFTAESLEKELRSKGWQIYPLKNDPRYSWLQKGKTYVLAYHSISQASVDLYFGQVTGPPAEQADTATYSYTQTNWDDGWVSTIESDKVVVARAGIRVWIYYARPFDDASRAGGRDYFWDQVIARQFRIISKQYQDGGEVMAAFQPPYIEGRAIDPASGRPCFLALFLASGSGWMYPTLAIAPDEASLRNTFPRAADKAASDLGKMRNYNRFALSSRDLVGQWIGGSSGAMDYYSAYTGNYLGMNAAVSSDEFGFSTEGNYRSRHKGASGMVGNMGVYQLEYHGPFKAENWAIQLGNRQDGKTVGYSAYFEAVPGGRILHLQHQQYSSQVYHLVRKPSPE